jgi:hypothetical protein
MTRHIRKPLLYLLHFLQGEAGRTRLIILLEVLYLLKGVVVPSHLFFPFLERLLWVATTSTSVGMGWHLLVRWHFLASTLLYLGGVGFSGLWQRSFAE